MRRTFANLALVVLVGCAPVAERPGQGPGGREQPLALSPKQELAVGRRAYRQVMEEYGDRVLPADRPEVQRVRRVTERLARASEIEPLQREILLQMRGYRFEWEANVIRDSQINAFCLPAGKVFVFTGILPVVGRDDDYLATVLSHEIAHALAHHASERVARQQSGTGVFRSLQYDRMQESEADHIGVFLMPFAGYDPNKAVGFWRRMDQATGAGGRLPEFLSDHPNPAHRIRDLQGWAPKAIAAKRAYDEGRIAPSR
jgi:predicted Zn-dependent protease